MNHSSQSHLMFLVLFKFPLKVRLQCIFLEANLQNCTKMMYIMFPLQFQTQSHALFPVIFCASHVGPLTVLSVGNTCYSLCLRHSSCLLFFLIIIILRWEKTSLECSRESNSISVIRNNFTYLLRRV